MKTDYHILAEDLTLDECLADFKKMRKSIKKPMTDLAVKLLVNKLKRMSSDELEQKAMVLQSIACCWQTVYEVKDNDNKSDDLFSEIDKWTK